MEKEQTLSDKMRKWVQPIDKETKDVREAVKKLKEDIYHDLNGAEAYCHGIQNDMLEIIDKIFGDKLVDKA